MSGTEDFSGFLAAEMQEGRDVKVLKWRESIYLRMGITKVSDEVINDGDIFGGAITFTG